MSFIFVGKVIQRPNYIEVFALIGIITSLLSYFDTNNKRPVWLVVQNNGNGNDLLCKISSKVPCFPILMKLRSKKKFVYKFSLPPNITSPNGNALEWILSRKWDDWSWTSMAIKVAKRFFNQNYTSFHSHYYRLIPPTKRAVRRH
jgi:hypothetical protein